MTFLNYFYHKLFVFNLQHFVFCKCLHYYGRGNQSVLTTRLGTYIDPKQFFIFTFIPINCNIYIYFLSLIQNMYVYLMN